MKNPKTRLLAVTAAALLLAFLPVKTWAAEKTLTVGAGETADFASIQAAIDHLAGCEGDRTGWTIRVENGEYDRFTVPYTGQSGISGLTIEGESRQGVTVKVLGDEKFGLDDNGGINVFGTGVTLKNLTVKAGTAKGGWSASAISTHNGYSGGAGVTLSVENCTVIGPGVGAGALYGVFWDGTALHVTDCEIRGFSNAIEFMNDNYNIPVGDTCRLSGNIITDCSFAIHGYMGGGGGGGTLEIANNTVTGTKELRAKVIAQDNTGDSFTVKVSGNTLQNALIGVVNLQDEGDKNNILRENTFGENTFYVEAIEPGTIEYYTTYHAPPNAAGHWALGRTEGWEEYNPGVELSVIEKAVEDANKAHAKTLSITGAEGTLIKTFTYLKDVIYWVTDTTPPPGPDPWPGWDPDPEPELNPATGGRDMTAAASVLAAVSLLGMAAARKR